MSATTTPTADAEQRAILAADVFAAALQRTTAKVDALAKSLGIVVQAIKTQRQASNAASVPGGGNAPNTSLPSADLEKIQGLARSVGTALESAFTRGRSALFSFVDAASPSAISTFHASVTMLQQEIGSAFVPYVDAASGQIQRWAKSFSELDDGTKTTIARVALFAGSLGGVTVIGRALIPVLMSAAGALRMIGTVALTTPVGQIVTLATAVAGLAAAWLSVSQSATSAGSAMASTNIRLNNPLASTTPAQFGPVTPEMLPPDLRDRYNAWVGDQAPGWGNSATERQKILDEFRLRRAEIPREQLTLLPPELQRDYAAARTPERREEVYEKARQFVSEQTKAVTGKEIDALPPDVAEKVRASKSPAESRAILAEYEKTLRAEESQRLGSVPQELARLSRAQQQLNDEAAQAVAQLTQQYREAVNRFTKRTGRTPEDAVKNARAEQFLASEELADIEQAAKGIRERLAATAKQQGLTGEQTPTVRVGPNAPPSVAPGKAVEYVGGVDDAVRKIRATLSTVVNLSARLAGSGPQDDMLRNVKSPVASRFTDAFQYAESVQTAVLNTGDADAKVLARQMAELVKVNGDLTEALRRYHDRMNRTTDNSSWLGGVVTITDR